jgi:glucosyl-3-phosphoglycerate synthase
VNLRAPTYVAEQVRHWLRTHTYHHTRFADVRRLVELKEKFDEKISLCLPTLNEEATIGKEILLLRTELMQRHPLLDEIVVIDSGSSDRTCEIAAEFGAHVWRSDDVLPSHGTYRGKGENLWKALFVCSGEIVVFVDADIRNIRPSFVYGLVGPLLEDPSVEYVKAFYDRPLEIRPGERGVGGGRVTELVVRPMLSLWVPELTALVQPLSGEYAARRSVLERLAFPVGYGVEIAHLLDVYHRGSLNSFAQVDLDVRIHRNQSLDALGRMSFGILQTMLRRLQQYGYIESKLEWHGVLHQCRRHDEGCVLVDTPWDEPERPPMIEVPEYRRRVGASSRDASTP